MPERNWGYDSNQRQFLEAALDRSGRYKVLAYGGRRGPGKSDVSCTANVLRSMVYAGTHHIMLRRVQKAADLNLGRKIDEIMQERFNLPMGPVNRGMIQFFSKEHLYKFPNGSILELGFCYKEDDWQKHQGLEYAGVTFEEATQFPEEAFDKVGASNRSNVLDAPGIRIITFNPGGRGHPWVKTRIYDPATRDRRVLFIPASLRDCLPALERDPGYSLRVLRPLSPSLRRQWEDGDMDVVEGAYWSLPPTFWSDEEPPEWAEMHAALDPGFWPSAFGGIWVAKWREDDGRQRVHALADIKRHRLNLREQAEAVLEIEKRFKIRPKVRWADPNAWKRIESDDAATISTAYKWSQYGVTCTPAPKTSRAAGWLLMRTVIQEGVFTAHPRCGNLKTELLSATHDQHSDDMSEECEDHVLDPARYILIATIGLDGARKKTEQKRKRWVRGQYRPDVQYMWANSQ